MATTYGMGQYRMKRGTPYITKLNGENSITPQFIEVQTNTYTYKDVYFNLGNETIQYGHTYYLELTLPRHVQYTSDIDIKICGTANGTIDITNQYQNIKQIIVPNSLASTNFYQDVLLYEYQVTDDNNQPITDKDNQPIFKTDVGLVTIDAQDDTVGHVFKNNNNYFLITKNGKPQLEKYQPLKVIESWKLKEMDEDTITYNMIFSPKFDSINYSYLYLEIDRNNDWNTSIEYIENDKTYKGLFIDINNAKLDIYEVNNLLNNDTCIPQSSLNHIGVWGHPEMYLAINGEQIQIGKNGFYELDDFNITNLGIVVKDENIDRFSIDYEFAT